MSLTDRKLTVTWARGKTVARRGPYTVHTIVPATPMPILSDSTMLALTATSTDTTLLFGGVTGPHLKLALRTADSALEQRSIRRGALQTLAALGMPLSTPLLFSGHSTEKMLLRYLGHGRMAAVQRNEMISVADMAFGAAQ